MPDEYVVPFGVDAAPFLKGIGDMETATDDLTAKAEQSNKTMQGAFDNTGAAAKRAAQAAAEYQAQLDINAKSAQSYFQLNERLRILNEALFTETDRGRIKLYQQEIDKTKASIQQLQNIGKIGFDATGKAIERQSGLIEQLRAKINLYKDAMTKATDPTRIAGLNKVIEQTTKELTALSNAGKTGFDNLGNALDKTSASIEKTAKSTNVLSKGFGFIRQAAYLIPGIGIAGIFNLIGEAVVSLAGNLFKAGDSFDALAQKAKLAQTVQEAADKDAGKRLTDLKLLYAATQNVTLSTKQRTDAVIALQAEFPDAFKNISQETILNGGAAKSYDDLTKSILATARATAAKTQLDQLAAQQLDLDFQRQKIINATNQQLAKAAATRITAPGVSGGLGGDLNLVESKAAVEKDITNRREAALKINDIDQKRIKDQTDFLIKFAGGEQALVEVVETKDAKKIKNAQDTADKLAKIREQELKTFQTLLAKLQATDDSLQATAIEDNRASQLAASDAKFKKIADDAQREVDQAKVSNSQRVQLQKAADKVILDSVAANNAAKLDINKKFDDAQLKLQENAQRALDSIGQNSQENQLAAINKKYADLTATIKKGGLLTKQAEIAIQNARINEISDNEIKFGTKAIQDKEKLDIQAIESDQKFADKSVAIQKEKNLAILQVELKAAEDTLSLLISNGKTEQDEIVKNAEQLIANLKAKIAGVEGNKGKGQTLLEFLGITPDGQRNLGLYAQAASEAGKITSDFLAGLVDANQQAIDAKQKLIDQDNQELEDLQARLDKETQLRDQGLANNVDAIQRELDAKKKARDEDLKSQKQLQDKQNALKKAQIIADSIAQVSNLITAASQIFEAFSAIPIVGVPLAIAAIGLMFGAFAVAKVNALKAVDSGGQTFGEGGYIDGKPHTQGGKKYRAIDGKGVVELEGGEHVTNKRSTKKYSTLLDAINNDDLSGMSEDGLKEMFASLGIGFGVDSPREAVRVIHKHNELKQTVNLTAGPADGLSKDVKQISTNVNYLAEKERNRTERWEENGYVYIKKGNKTTKFKK
jgi:hypothetical protein